MKDPRGRLIPVEMVRDVDLLRDQVTQKLSEKAERLSASIKEFKAEALEDIRTFVELSAERYGVRMRGSKGNISLLTYDGRYKIQRAVADRLVFDERLQVAKELVDACITEWAVESRPEIRTLINDAFQVDREGKVNAGRILGLRRLNIEDARWQLAMQAISDSLQVQESTVYVRFYRKNDESDLYEPISLDIASTPVRPEGATCDAEKKNA